MLSGRKCEKIPVEVHTPNLSRLGAPGVVGTGTGLRKSFDSNNLVISQYASTFGNVRMSTTFETYVHFD